MIVLEYRAWRERCGYEARLFRTPSGISRVGPSPGHPWLPFCTTMRHTSRALVVATLLVALAPLTANAQTAPATDIATAIDSIVALPTSVQEDFISNATAISNARAVGNAGDIANAENIYDIFYGGTLSNASVQLLNA